MTHHRPHALDPQIAQRPASTRPAPRHLGVWVCVVAALTVLLAAVPARAQERAPIAARYVGAPPLAALAAGAVGQGIVLYGPQGAAPDRPGLVVRLSRAAAGAARAEVFDAPDDRGYVPLRPDGSDVEPGQQPTIVMTAPDGWWVRDGVVNYNLDIETRGPIFAAWSAGNGTARRSTGWRKLVARGTPAVQIAVRDPANEGAPRWDLRQVTPDFGSAGYLRLHYAERKCAPPSRRELGPNPLWPFVSGADAPFETGAEQQFEQATDTLAPPIVVDWARGRVSTFAELVSVRHQPCSYSLYSIRPASAGLMQPNFETPFAFYDLAGGAVKPNLIVRTERYPARDMYSAQMEPQVQRGVAVPTDFQTIRYSWRLAPGDDRWDFKLDLLGFVPYGRSTPLGDGRLQIDAPDYAELPGWVVSQAWPAVSFVDTDGRSYPSTEGIYDYAPRNGGVGYVLGLRDTFNHDALAAIRPGFRGEYRVDGGAQPATLYLSPVDGRLHLLGAERGVWNLGGGQSIALDRIGDGVHINSWTLAATRLTLTELRDQQRIALTTQLGRAPDAETLDAAVQTALSQPETQARVKPQPATAQLLQLGGYLITSSGTTLSLRRSATPAASLTLAPPTNPAEWQRFRDQLAPLRAAQPAAADLARWAERLGGSAQTISGASLGAAQALPDGYSFTLRLAAGYATSGADWLALANVAPGSYTVTVRGETLELAPLAAAAVQPAPTQVPALVAPALAADAPALLAQAPRREPLGLLLAGLLLAALIAGVTAARRGFGREP